MMYGYGNPVKYNDPSGHCATLADGSPNTAGDAECWNMAYFIYGQGTSDPESFAAIWNISPEEWLQNLAPLSVLDTEYMRPHYERSYTDFCRQTGLQCGGHSYVPPTLGEYSALPNPCNFWDCPGIALNLASLGLSVAQTTAVACTATGAGAPVCGPAAMYFTSLDISVNAASIAYETYGYIQGGSTTFDLSVALADGAAKPVIQAASRGASSTPGVGVGYDLLMLGYDLFIDPFMSTPGGAKTVR